MGANHKQYGNIVYSYIIEDIYTRDRTLYLSARHSLGVAQWARIAIMGKWFKNQKSSSNSKIFCWVVVGTKLSSENKFQLIW